MPVVAHQTRQQFRPQDPNYGATAASPTKVFFTLSPIDANEMPLVFAKEPPTQSKLEEQLVISQNPVSGLLRGQHKDPEIRRFVTKYLRYLEDKREDIKADMAGEIDGFLQQFSIQFESWIRRRCVAIKYGGIATILIIPIVMVGALYFGIKEASLFLVAQRVGDQLQQAPSTGGPARGPGSGWRRQVGGIGCSGDATTRVCGDDILRSRLAAWRGFNPTATTSAAWPAAFPKIILLREAKKGV